jgi:transposase
VDGRAKAPDRRGDIRSIGVGDGETLHSNANLLFKWKREAEADQLGGALATTAVADLVPIGVVGRGAGGAPTLLASMPGDGNGLRPSEPCRSAELAAPAGVIEIDLPCGTRVRVDAAVDARALGRVLGALKRYA